MKPLLSFLAGLATLPAAVFVVGLVTAARRRDLSIECGCGYKTGPFGRTTRATVWRRWIWHNLTRHHRVRLP